MTSVAPETNANCNITYVIKLIEFLLFKHVSVTSNMTTSGHSGISSLETLIFQFNCGMYTALAKLLERLNISYSVMEKH